MSFRRSSYNPDNSYKSAYSASLRLSTPTLSTAYIISILQ